MSVTIKNPGYIGFAMASVFMVAELITLIFCFTPFVIYRYNIGRWKKDPILIPNSKSSDDVLILLPVWNEAKIIQNKLKNILSQGVKCNLMIIDSASTDDTVLLAEKWLEKHNDAFFDYKIIKMKKRKGKTAAIALALENLRDYSGLIMMTDADAVLMPGAIDRIKRWFSDATIGAVGATPRRQGSIQNEHHHRALYSSLRYGESCYDSTPFLEGSLLTWRSHLFESTDLHVGSNADDAQIAMQVRLNGYRTIQDPELFFEDQIPNSIKEQYRQKIRRSQGLIRLLMRKKSECFNNSLGRYSYILKMQIWMMLISPLMLFAFAIFSILRQINFILSNSSFFGVMDNFELLLTIIEIFLLIFWVISRQGKSLGIFQPLGTVLTGLEALFMAMIFSARGQSLHMWDQHIDTREKSKLKK